MNEREELMAELGAELGDPRRCRRHPWEVTSSPDGMFDSVCGSCEYESETGRRAEAPSRPVRAPEAQSAGNASDEDIPF